MNAHSKESILVCVYYGPNAERLVRRGAKIAEAMHAPLSILTVDPLRDDEYNVAKERNMAEWKKLAEQTGAEFIAIENRTGSVAEAIVEIAKQKGITQIVLGQSARTRWEELTKGNIVNDILRRIDLVDLHVVAVQRQVPPEAEEQFEPGVRAHLVRTDDGETAMVLGESPEDKDEGIFFKYANTDFDSGIFRIVQDNRKTLYKISDGIVKEDVTDKLQQ